MYKLDVMWPSPSKNGRVADRSHERDDSVVGDELNIGDSFILDGDTTKEDS